MLLPARVFEQRPAMTLDFFLGGAATALLLAYMVFAVVWPEKL